MIDIKEYLTSEGRSPFAEWFTDLDRQASAKVRAAAVRLGNENFSCVKGVGEGVFDYKLDYGPGYRMYFGKNGSQIIILLAGGTKKRQNADIKDAKVYWKDYKFRKKQES